MISNCGHDESGQYSGGQAGDQTGGEWQIQEWYNRPWNVVLRHPDKNIGNMLAELAREAANNPNIGYDQNQRTSFYWNLMGVDWRPSRITTPCETDCSAGVAALVIATGYLSCNKDLQGISPDIYTGNERAALVSAGFEALTDEKYRTSDRYLLPGDILLLEGHHTAINLSYGSEVIPVKYDYEQLGWNKDSTGWWYAWGHMKGEYHTNNIVRINDKKRESKLWAFDTEGYLVNPNRCEMNADGSIKYIRGDRVKI